METIANTIGFFMSAFLNLFEGLNLQPVGQAIETVKPYIQTALYILPARTIYQIFSVVVILWSIRLTIKAVRTLWDLLPLV